MTKNEERTSTENFLFQIFSLVSPTLVHSHCKFKLQALRCFSFPNSQFLHCLAMLNVGREISTFYLKIWELPWRKDGFCWNFTFVVEIYTFWLSNFNGNMPFSHLCEKQSTIKWIEMQETSLNSCSKFMPDA